MGDLRDRLVAAIDVGGTSMKGALIDCRGRLVSEVETRLTKDPGRGTAEAVIENLTNLANSLAAKGNVKSPDGLVALGIGVPGIIDEQRGVALVALNVEWCGDPLVERLSNSVRLPTVLSNDARVAGTAEGLWGAAAGYDDFLFIALGTGVGGATVVRGEPYVRHGGAGGEFGHMTINSDGADCTCGRRGCLEAYSSGSAIGRRYSIRSNRKKLVTGKDVFLKAAAGEPLAKQVWHEAVSALAGAIVNYIALMSPDAIIIGGGVSDAGDLLFEPLRKLVMDQMPSFHPLPPPPILPASFGRDAGIVGAGALAWMTQGFTRRQLVTTFNE